MRILFTIASFLSVLILLTLAFFWTRSYSRFEGIVHYDEGSPTLCISNPETTKTYIEVETHSTGLISYKGQLTWASVANPLRSKPWEKFSVSVDAPPGDVTALMFEPRMRKGLSWASTLTAASYSDVNGVPWKLGYSFVTAPYWFLMLAAAILPWRWTMNLLLRRRRTREGRCPTCGHDMHHQKGPCPTCGTHIN